MTNSKLTGQWISEDGKIVTPDPNNLFRYVGNNPTNATDPTGLAAVADDLQAKVISGVPVKPVDDVSGPDVTEWFARDIVSHILYRAKRLFGKPGQL
jgi:hypothetical protein